MKDYTWFFRGVQSAIFLYASCGPCYDYRDQKRRRKEAKRSRAEKQALRDADPVANHQPAPFEINPFWHEEIELGPGPPARRVKKQKQKEKSITTTLPIGGRALTESSTAEGLLLVEQPSHGKRLEAKMEQYKDRLKTLDPAHLKENWHNRRQRRDEEYIDSDDETDDGSGAHFHLRKPSQTAKMKYSSRHYMTRAPPVNDLHPPIVCTPSPHAQERKWMKERPPSAAFMAGKEGTRTSAPSRSVSRASNMPHLRTDSSPRASPSLTRKVTSRTAEERLRRGEVPDTFLMPRSRASSTATPPPGRSSPHLTPETVRVVDYADTSTPESSLDINRNGISMGSRRRRRPSALRLTTDDSTDTEDGDAIPTATTTTTIDSITKPEPSHQPLKTSTQRARTQHARLSTILSSRDGNMSPGSLPVSTAASPSIGPVKHRTRDNSIIGSENMSPTLSARSEATSPTASPAASPIPFQARTHSTSITSAPVSPLLVPQPDDLRSDSKLDQSRPVITVRDSSLDVLQELVSPSSLLNARLSRGSDREAIKLKLPGPASDGTTDDADIEDDMDDDGWLWTETGERKWPDQREARNVKNRWSIDF